MKTDWRLNISFALGWAIIIALCVVWNFVQKGWFFDIALFYIAAVYFCGAFFGGFIALFLSSRKMAVKSATVRFSFFFVVLSVFTIGATALVLILQHRIYFTQWHAPVGTITWSFQLFFTALGSAVLFLISGLRPLLPWGIACLFVASILFSLGTFTRNR